MYRTMRAVLACFVFLAPSVAVAASIVPGPNDPGHDASLAALAAEYDRQFHLFNAEPFGVSLDAFVPVASDRDLIVNFFAQSATNDFATFTGGRTVDDVIPIRGEYGDLGMFGGVAAVGEAFRYAVLRDGAGTPAEVAAARDDLLDAIAAFAVYADITGTRGTIARGIRLATEPGDPPQPLPATCASAGDRMEEIWRNDVSGRHPGWLWKDNTSKDQLLGYVMALGVFWDVVATDPTIPQSVKDGITRDALDMGTSLMTPVEVRPGAMLDLVIRDANDCLVRFHDLNPREIPNGSFPLILPETSTNRIAFNALAALGIIRTLYHITGDDTLRRYYYDELVTARGYPAQLTTGAARLYNMFANGCVGGNCVVTNFSNVNMAWVAIYGVLRYETDPALRQTYVAAMESDLWSGPRPHMGDEIDQPWFDLLYTSFRAGGNDATLAAEAAAQLAEWPAPPYFDPAVVNCDPAELMAGTCIAIDGTTVITLDDNSARGGRIAGVDPLPKRLRPPNNFEWRSDPRVVNGGGGSRLNPGGDFRAAYWLGRFMVASPSATANLSPIARNPDGTGGPPTGSDMDAGVADAGTDRDGGTPPDAGDVDAGQRDASTRDGGTPAVDGGVARDGGVSVAARDAGETKPPTAAPDDEGCSCRTERRGLVGSAWWLVFALLFRGRWPRARRRPRPCSR